MSKFGSTLEPKMCATRRFASPVALEAYSRANWEASFEQISLAKKVNVKMACEVAKKSRSVLGGMGITGEYPIMRHINNLEALVTYQGTDEIHTLIIGKKVTGISAIK